VYGFLEYRVKHVMNDEPVTIPESASLSELAELFDEHGFNSAPVTDADGNFVGVVTKLDLLGAFRFDEDHMFPPYSQIMKRKVATVAQHEVHAVTPMTPLTRVLEALVREGRKSFPVLDADRRLVGIVAREDVLRALRESAAPESSAEA